MVHGFEYGNGVKHSTTLNTRQVPECILDYTSNSAPACGSSASVLNLKYHYDNNLNITAINNPQDDGIYGLSSLEYDGLDCLTNTRDSITSGSNGIGDSRITYDGLGNIRSYRNTSVFNPHDISYQYNTDNRLSGVTGIGISGYQFNRSDSSDARGNVTHNGQRDFTYNLADQMTQSGASQFTYDGHNRRVKYVKDDGSTEYSLYSQSGTLLYRETAQGGINYIYLGKKLVAKEGLGVTEPENSVTNYKPLGKASNLKKKMLAIPAISSTKSWA